MKNKLKYIYKVNEPNYSCFGLLNRIWCESSHNYKKMNSFPKADYYSYEEDANWAIENILEYND